MPGATTWPRASITRSPSLGSTKPIAAMRPSFTATSARRRGRPVPSTTIPLVITRSSRAISPTVEQVLVSDNSGGVGGGDGCCCHHHLGHRDPPRRRPRPPRLSPPAGRPRRGPAPGRRGDEGHRRPLLPRRGVGGGRSRRPDGPHPPERVKSVGGQNGGP